MPVLSDFVKLLGDDSQRIGDGTVWLIAPNTEMGFGYPIRFKTTNRLKDKSAFLIFSVRDLGNPEGVKVWLNNEYIGRITGVLGEALWFTQTIAFQSQHLNAGEDEENVLWVEGERIPNSDNKYYDFYIKDMFCFFHQSV